MARYEVSDGTAHKFWEITLAGRTYTVRSGRIGTRGKTSVQHFPDEAQARREYDKLVKDKLRKGYKLVDGIEEPVAAAPVSSVVARSPELEAAVIADPNDEGALMVLGDWLQTQGDARGELISLQHALKQAGTDPKLFMERKRAADTYYKQHEAALLGPLHPLRHLFKLEWQLGYIRAAKLSVHAARGSDPSLAELLRLVVDVPAAVALQELGFGVAKSRDYQPVIDVLAEGKPFALRSLAFGEYWPGFDQDQGRRSVGSFGHLEGGFPELRKLAVPPPARLGAWKLPELRQFELRGTLDPETHAWLDRSCPKLELLSIDALQNTPLHLDPARVPNLRKLRVRSARYMVDAIADCAILRQLEGIELGQIDGADAIVLTDRWSAFAHCKTVRVSLELPLHDPDGQGDRILRRLRAQTTADVTVRKVHDP